MIRIDRQYSDTAPGSPGWYQEMRCISESMGGRGDVGVPRGLDLGRNVWLTTVRSAGFVRTTSSSSQASGAPLLFSATVRIPIRPPLEMITC